MIPFTTFNGFRPMTESDAVAGREGEAVLPGSLTLRLTATSDDRHDRPRLDALRRYAITFATAVLNFFMSSHEPTVMRA
jgi:hypothetical protein